MRKEYLALILLFLSGLWIAQVIGREYFLVNGYLNPYYLKNFADVKMDYVDLFWNLLWTRGKQWVGILILQMTPWRRMLPVVFRALFVFLSGFFLMVSCMVIGSTGLLFLFAALFPHGICYLIAFVGVFELEGVLSWNHPKNGRQVAGKIGICLLFLVSGCVLETVIGTRLLRYVLKASKL